MRSIGWILDAPFLNCIVPYDPDCLDFIPTHWGLSIFPLSLSDVSVWQNTGGLTPEGSQCSLVVSGAFDGRLRLWDIDPTAVIGGRANMLGTLSNKVRLCEREISLKQNESDSQGK